MVTTIEEKIHKDVDIIEETSLINPLGVIALYGQ